MLYLLRVPCTSHIQFKTCSEQYGGQLLVDVSKLCNDFSPHFKYLPLPGNAKPFRWAISEQTRPSALGNDQEFRRWQNLGRNWKSSPWSYLLIFNLKTQYHESQCVVVVLESLFLPKSSQNFIGHNFPSSVLLTVVFLQNSQVNLQYYRVISYWDGF